MALNLSRSINFYDNFEPTLIDVYDYETKELIYSKTALSKVERLLTIKKGSIFNSFKSKKPYYQNRKTKKCYIFKYSKNDSK